MINRLWLFGLIFGIPLLGLMTSEGIQVYYNSQLRSAAQKQVPDIDPKVLSGLSLDRICEKPNPEMAEVCSANSHLNLMTIGSVGAAALGLALILAIYFAGSAAQNDRRLLLSIFKPGFYVTVIVLIGLVILNATIMMAALYYGESVLINRVHLFIIGAVGIGAFLGIKSMISISSPSFERQKQG